MLSYVSQLIAQINPIGNPVLAPNFQSFNSPFDYFNTILPTLITIGFIIGAVIFIFIFMVGAFQWITAGGDKGKLEDARHKITHAIVGLVIMLLVWFIVQMVNLILGINIGMIGFPPVAPTPPPNRPEICDTLDMPVTTLGPGESITATLFALEPGGAKSFWLAFYNEDNQNPDTPGIDNPERYCKQLDAHNNCIQYVIYYDAISPPETSHQFTITYDDVDDPDLNPTWNGTVPIRFQVSGYFYDMNDNQSAPNVNCIRHINIARTIQCSNTGPSCGCLCGPGEIPDPTTSCNLVNPPTCGTGTCRCIPCANPIPANKFESLTIGSRLWLYDNKCGVALLPNPYCWNVDLRTDTFCTGGRYSAVPNGINGPCATGEACDFETRNIYFEGGITKTESLIQNQHLWLWVWGGNPPAPTPSASCFNTDLNVINSCSSIYHQSFEGTNNSPCDGAFGCDWDTRAIYFDWDGRKVVEITRGNMFWKYKADASNTLQPVSGCYGVDLNDLNNQLTNCNYMKVFREDSNGNHSLPCYQYQGCSFIERQVYVDTNGYRNDSVIRDQHILWLATTAPNGNTAVPSICWGVDLTQPGPCTGGRYTDPPNPPCPGGSCRIDTRAIYVQP